jgi:pilus assembly protein Flp/PilA
MPEKGGVAFEEAQMGQVAAMRRRALSAGKALGRFDAGQGLVEYALVLMLIAIVVIFLLTFIGAKLNETFSQVGSGFGP